MKSMGKHIAVFLLGIFTLIIGGTGTGIHIHHENHGFEEPAIIYSFGEAETDNCRNHCDGETIFDHLLGNHGSLYSRTANSVPVKSPIAVIEPYILIINPPPAATPALEREEIIHHLILQNTLPERAPPFSV